MSESNKDTEVVRKKKKWLIPVIIGGIVALILAIFAAVIVSAILSVTAPKRKLQKQLDLGEKYLAELDYEHAILAYKAAIEIDPKCEEAYLAIGSIYESLANGCAENADIPGAIGYLDEGINQLMIGYMNTNSEDIYSKQQELENKKKELQGTDEGDEYDELAEYAKSKGFIVNYLAEYGECIWECHTFNNAVQYQIILDRYEGDNAIIQLTEYGGGRTYSVPVSEMRRIIDEVYQLSLEQGEPEYYEKYRQYLIDDGTKEEKGVEGDFEEFDAANLPDDCKLFFGTTAYDCASYDGVVESLNDVIWKSTLFYDNALLRTEQGKLQSETISVYDEKCVDTVLREVYHVDEQIIKRIKSEQIEFPDDDGVHVIYKDGTYQQIHHSVGSDLTEYDFRITSVQFNGKKYMINFDEYEMQPYEDDFTLKGNGYVVLEYGAINGKNTWTIYERHYSAIGN